MKIIIIVIILIIIYYILITSNQIIQRFQDKDKYKFGILICCYNRPQFLLKTLESLKKSNLENCFICIIDDHSYDTRTTKLIRNFSIKGVKIIKKRNSHNLGIAKSLLLGFEILFPQCEYLTNIDSDVIMKKDWLTKLESTYKKAISLKLGATDYVVTGFNCIKCMHPIIKTYTTLCHKKSIGGVNMFYHRKLYKPLFKKVLSVANKNHGWDWSIVDIGKKMNIWMITTKPSVIQHIGISGLNSSSRRYDIAPDF